MMRSHAYPKRTALALALCALAGLAYPRMALGGVQVPVCVNTTADSGIGSLRQAISTANATPGPDTICFAIPGAGVHTITLSSPLPPILEAVTIDGYTQPGSVPNDRASVSNAVLQIELSGANLQPSTFGNDGLTILANSCTIRGLVINRFQGDPGNPGPDSGNGVVINGGSSNRVVGNFIGTDPSGTVARPNSASGVRIVDLGPPAAPPVGGGRQAQAASGNLIGGSVPGDRNVIAGNDGPGVRIEGATSSGNLIQGNLIGLCAPATARLDNGADGVAILDAPGNIVGGTNTGEGNTISGNTENGVRIDGLNADGCTVQGNMIGTNPAGSVAIPNLQDGVVVNEGADNNQIGGAGAVGGAERAAAGLSGAGNLISGNGGNGVRISGVPVSDLSAQEIAVGNVVQSNFIGTNVSGNFPVPNGGDGVLCTNASGTTIGGNTLALGNVISGNGGNGIEFAANGTAFVVQNNAIGTEANGIPDAGNGGNGILVNGFTSSIIGGGVNGLGNVIAGNVAAGVAVTGASSSIQIRLNSIYNNGGLGIDLGATGVTPNDPGDVDMGPNRLQNAPVLTTATAAEGEVTIGGTIDSTPNVEYRVDFFLNPAADPSGFGEGRTFISSQDVNTDAAGAGSFLFTLALPNSSGQFITATATSQSNDTSEFSNALRVGGSSGEVLTVTPNPLDFGKVPVGETVTKLVRVKNKREGNGGVGAQVATAVGVRAILKGVFSAAADEFFLDDGESRLVPVRFTPRGVGSFSGILTILAPNASRPTIRVRLRGEGCRKNPFKH